MGDFKERLGKIDERVVALAKRYPLVFTAVLVGGFIAGLVLGGWLL
jgi:hypothetical protein